VSVELLVNDRLVDLLEGEFDVGVRIGRLRDSSLIARRIGPISGGYMRFIRPGGISRPRCGALWISLLRASAAEERVANAGQLH
jgi:hypothetical protein